MSPTDLESENVILVSRKYFTTVTPENCFNCTLAHSVTHKQQRHIHLAIHTHTHTAACTYDVGLGRGGVKNEYSGDAGLKLISLSSSLNRLI